MSITVASNKYDVVIISEVLQLITSLSCFLLLQIGLALGEPACTCCCACTLVSLAFINFLFLVYVPPSVVFTMCDLSSLGQPTIIPSVQ